MIDVGCGEGSLGRGLKQQRPGLEVRGIEIDVAAAASGATHLDDVLCAQRRRCASGIVAAVRIVSCSPTCSNTSRSVAMPEAVARSNPERRDAGREPAQRRALLVVGAAAARSLGLSRCRRARPDASAFLYAGHWRRDAACGGFQIERFERRLATCLPRVVRAPGGLLSDHRDAPRRQPSARSGLESRRLVFDSISLRRAAEVAAVWIESPSHCAPTTANAFWARSSRPSPEQTRAARGTRRYRRRVVRRHVGAARGVCS